MSLHPTGPWAGLHSPGLPAHLQADKGPLSLGSASCPPTVSLTSRGPGCQALPSAARSPGPWRGHRATRRLEFWPKSRLCPNYWATWKAVRCGDREPGLWGQTARGEPCLQHPPAVCPWANHVPLWYSVSPSSKRTRSHELTGWGWYSAQLLAQVRTCCHYGGPSFDPASSALSAVRADSLSLGVTDILD